MNKFSNNELKSAGFPLSLRSAGMTECGRSMVEMLGVLAVIGVLSVAGIAGYSIAMRSYRTNEIVNAASMFYVLAMAQNAGNGPSGTESVGYDTVGGTNPSGATLAYDPTGKSITITFNDPNDCTMALNKLGDKASANTCSATPATITVNFGDGQGVEDKNIDTCTGIKDTNGNCHSCPTGTDGNTDDGAVPFVLESECRKCPNTFYFVYSGVGNCISCNCSEACPPKPEGSCT